MCTHVCVYMYVCVFMCVCMYTYIFKYIYIPGTYTAVFCIDFCLILGTTLEGEVAGGGVMSGKT
jgi:hypothetical protein